MTCTDQCKVDDKFFCFIAVVDQNYWKCQFIVTQDVLRKALKVFMKDKMNLLQQLMENRLKAALNTRDNIISHLGMQNYDQVERPTILKVIYETFFTVCLKLFNSVQQER